ncbi:MAG: helix-turn-helix domain-containing protein [Oscillospiraceae bacterium]|nr:helix-turn-helix domain-containing protein [Oscillospiraceae bacterium]MDE6088424.1 helix-turn-helix domain-containing protein [Oscillospiraceae bacterium]
MKEYLKTRQYLHIRIRALRKQAHLTQQEMASLLGISRRTYANYERGVHAMPVEVLVCIADIFDVSLDYLVGRELSDYMTETLVAV